MLANKRFYCDQRFDELSQEQTSVLDDFSHSEQLGRQFLGFKIHREEFLILMTDVKEIIMLPSITYAPKTKDSIEGVFALRGEIMPVVNMRRLLGFERGVTLPSTRVVIAQADSHSFGIIVDEITDFVWLQNSEIDFFAQNFFGSRYQLLGGVSKIGAQIRGIIDLLKLVKMLGPGYSGEHQVVS